MLHEHLSVNKKSINFAFRAEWYMGTSFQIRSKKNTQYHHRYPRLHDWTIHSGCNSHQKTTQIVAAFAPNTSTSTMIRLTSLKELGICVGCVAEMEFMPIVGRKNHWN